MLWLNWVCYRQSLQTHFIVINKNPVNKVVLCFSFFSGDSKHIPNRQTLKVKSCLRDPTPVYPVSSTGHLEKASNPAGLFCRLFIANKQRKQNNQRKQLSWTKTLLSRLLPFTPDSMSGMSRHSSRHKTGKFELFRRGAPTAPR